jgi:predicted choloylglycine hydrolase
MEIFYDYMSKLKLDRDDHETSIWVTLNKDLVLFYDFRGEILHISNDFYQMLKSAFPFIDKYDLVVWFEKSYNVNVVDFAV